MSNKKQIGVEVLIQNLDNNLDIKHSWRTRQYIEQAKELEKQQKDDYAIYFVCWLMDNCKLISTEEEENVLWRYESEDYIIDTLLEIFKKEKGYESIV